MVRLKNYLTKLALLAIVAMLPQLASAHDFEVGGIYYNINGNNATVTYRGSYSNEYSNEYTGAVNIPSTVTYNGTTYSVTSIGGSAFYGCTGLTSVTIPNSVTSISSGAFASCRGLTSMVVESGNTKYDSRNNCNAIIETATNTLISGCKNTIIPNSVKRIGSEAFDGCSSLTSVTIPNSVTSIGDYAFYGCTGLTSVTIPNSVTYIGNYAFYGCRGLTGELTIPNSVTSIGSKAFYNCSGLTGELTIPNSVTTIGEWAFEYCNNLTSLIIGSSVSYIGNETFSFCSGLISIIVDSGNTKWDSRNNCNAIIQTNTNTLYLGCKNTIIPNSVNSIGPSAFYGCSGLNSVTIPNSVTSVSSYAFNSCTGLTSVTIPNSVKGIGSYAFADCSSLTSVNLGNSVTSIGYGAFSECSGLTSLTIPNSVTSISSGAFSECSGLTSLTLTGQGDWLPKNNMPSLSKVRTLNIGSGITSLGNFKFLVNVVNCYAETPPSCLSTTFSYYQGELHVPTTSIASYFMADYWQNFNNMVNDLTDKITLDLTTANLIQGETLALATTVFPENSELVWSTSNPSVATVDENGVVTATGEGECDIFAILASNSAVYAWCHITSSYPEITLTLSDESLEMNLSEERTLTAIITPENTGLTPTWSSSNTSVATVDKNGKVTAIGEGECDITATVLDQTATCHVTVTNNVTVSLNIDNAIIGASQMLTVYPSCSPDVPVDLVVTSSDPSVAVARVVNRTNVPAEGLTSFPEKDMAMNFVEQLAASGETKAPALASTKAVTIVGVQNGTATITVTTADGKATPAVLELRVVDVDGDRTITSTDITCLYNYLLNGDDSFITTSDTNGDGFITSTDITVLYNLMLGN